MTDLLPTSPDFIENHPEIPYTDTQKYRSSGYLQSASLLDSVKNKLLQKEKGYRYGYL